MADIPPIRYLAPITAIARHPIPALWTGSSSEIAAARSGSGPAIHSHHGCHAAAIVDCNDTSFGICVAVAGLKLGLDTAKVAIADTS